MQVHSSHLADLHFKLLHTKQIQLDNFLICAIVRFATTTENSHAHFFPFQSGPMNLNMECDLRWQIVFLIKENEQNTISKVTGQINALLIYINLIVVSLACLKSTAKI